MARDARARFDRNCADVEQLLALDESIADDAAGSRQRSVLNRSKNDPHELAVWKLAGEGWRRELVRRTEALQESRNKKFNTPKTAQVVEFFRDGVGLPDVSKYWGWRGMENAEVPQKLDSFVTLRGAIAHRGRVRGVKREHVVEWLGFLRKLVTVTNVAVNDHVRAAVGTPLWGPTAADARTPPP